MSEQKLCFLIPYYNHPQKIAQLIAILNAYNYPILIIDDGSDEDSKKALRKLDTSLVSIYTREQNGGKGTAIKTGFEIAKQKGFSHCFQIDADMQHDLSKIPDFLAAFEANPHALICANPQYGSDAPKARLYGRKITDFWVYVNTLGGNLKDVMCGMRIYPIECMQRAIQNTTSNRMDFDIEILLYAYRENLAFVWIDVKVFYDSKGISHFDALRDNLKISRIHAKHFFAIPWSYMRRREMQNSKAWWEKQEKASMLWLKITLLCVIYLPSFLLKLLTYCVSSVYFVFSHTERKSLAKFHKNLQAYYPQNDFSHLRTYQHFYAFSECICDKFAIWSKKFDLKNIVFVNEEQKDAWYSGNYGQIILVSHFGNIEIARALEREASRQSKMNVLVHSQNTKKFSEIINQISGVDSGVFEVGHLGIEEMLTLKQCIDRGESIGIMGDRISLNPNQSKNIKVKFLGQECLLPSGAFLLAGLLKCPISMLWCEKRGKKYHITYEPLAQEIVLGQDKEASIRPYLERYVRSLEEKILHNPTQWFNFFDIWGQAE